MLTRKILNQIMDEHTKPLDLERETLFHLASEMIRRFELELTSKNVSHAIALTHGMLTIGYGYAKLEDKQ